MTDSTILSFVIGGYAAIVATIALVWNILKERSRIKLRVDALGVFESVTDAGELITINKIQVMIINDSYKPVTIKRVGLNYGSDYESSEEVAYPGSKLNLKKDLPAGDSQIWEIPMERVRGEFDGKPAKYIFVEDGRFKRYKMNIPKYIYKKKSPVYL